MIKQWIQYNLTILWFKITNKENKDNLYKYVFRNYESFKYKIDYDKDPFDCIDFDKIDKIVEKRISNKTPNKEPSLKEQYAILREKINKSVKKI